MTVQEALVESLVTIAPGPYSIFVAELAYLLQDKTCLQVLSDLAVSEDLSPETKERIAFLIYQTQDPVTPSVTSQPVDLFCGVCHGPVSQHGSCWIGPLRVCKGCR